MPHFPTAERPETAPNFVMEALDHVDIGILILDRDMRVRFVNRYLAEFIRLPVARLLAEMTFRELLEYSAIAAAFPIPADDLPEYLDQREAAVRAGSVSPFHIDFTGGRRMLFACDTCPDGGRVLTYIDVSRELRPETLDAMEQINAELRFNTETMEDHAAHLASLAEATDESARNIEEAKRELEREILERRQLEAQLRQMATTDGLTGALNRAGFMALAQIELDRLPSSGRGLALMMLDVDHFKSVNDRFGHAGGDLALKHLVTLLSGRTRRSDLLGRLGGEEFAILLPGIAPVEAERMAKRLVAFVEASPVMYGNTMIGITVSVGLTLATGEDRSIEQVLARADDALYRAKESGRNKVVTDRQMEPV